MLKVGIIERSAEARHSLTSSLEAAVAAGAREFQFTPRVTLLPLAPEELKFHDAPHICIVGEDYARSDDRSVIQIRESFPHATILVRISTSQAPLAELERIARLGADDVLSADATPREFLQKLIFISKRNIPKGTGRLIVCLSGKGGSGVTSVCGALGEIIASAGKRVVLVDLDSETQDLARFLQAKPYISENLDLIFQGAQALTTQAVEAAFTRPWSDVAELSVLAPAAAYREVYGNPDRVVRLLHAIMEEVDHLADYVVVDAADARGPITELMVRIADAIVVVVPPDPAALFACVDRTSELRTLMSPQSEFVLICNREKGAGLSDGVLAREFCDASGIDIRAWSSISIPWCSAAARWPGSGGTLFSQGNAAIKNSLSQLAVRLKLIDGESRGAESQASRIKLRLPGGQKCIELLGVGMGALKNRIQIFRKQDNKLKQDLLPQPKTDNKPVKLLPGPLESDRDVPVQFDEELARAELTATQNENEPKKDKPAVSDITFS